MPHQPPVVSAQIFPQKNDGDICGNASIRQEKQQTNDAVGTFSLGTESLQ